MDKSNFTKAERQQMRDLAGRAWDNELSQELSMLEAAFAEWRAGTCSAHDLNDRIHKFHNGPSRELYNCYMGCCDWFMVARAVRLGLLSKTDLPANLLAKLLPSIEFDVDRTS
ncbi:hypothetical protein [Schlesneria paludicola]|uniref:hypothetical protein n=1 Tax=Schlesneria paludicola TaxID=360056 RepID=UPI000299D86E|nr:hypothetical protein [Schlesneria paludicola]